MRNGQLRRPQPLGSPGWSRTARAHSCRAARARRGDAGPATIELRRLSDEMTAELDQFLRKRSTAFDDIDMPIDAARKLIQVAIDRFIDTKYASEISFEVPDDILQRFPAPVRAFFRPEASGGPGANR